METPGISTPRSVDSLWTDNRKLRERLAFRPEFSTEIDSLDFKAMVHTLAADEMEGRMSGTTPLSWITYLNKVQEVLLNLGVSLSSIN